ncbi:alpha/beta fold hydrolase [Dactylosporangium sp. CS-033363]|uniref:alpha/beta fold hydrolase n=1 Tax=Dactylosporangium sp. CS-033363 TaxID=3239935 RepID=UPI003D91613A
MRLHVRVHGDGLAGTPFLLVHGLSSNARLWDGVAAHLVAAGHPVRAVDLRSHGESPSPPDGYDTATAAADLASLLASLGAAPSIVAGQSWGGNVAVHLAALHPEHVRAVALVDGGWINLPAQFPTWAACEARLRPPDVNGLTATALRSRLRAAHPDWEPWAIEATVFNLVVHPDDSLSRRLPIPAHMRIVRSMWDDPPQPYYPRIGVPVLAIPAGSHPPDLGGLRDVRVRAYPGADHDVHAQHPADVAADLLSLA